MKQISDKEKIEIMQHFINGGEVEYQPSVTDNWYDIVEPTWNWYACNYRKKIYTYPLYFEYIWERGDTFFVEFDSLDSGTVIRVDSGKYKVGDWYEIWYPHTDISKWKQVENPIEKYFQSKLKYLDEIKQKFLTGNYICIWKMEDDIQISPNPIWGTDGEYKLIHKRHEDILSEYLKDNNIEIERRTALESPEWVETKFIENYDSTNDYRIKKPESKIVHEVYRVSKIEDKQELLKELMSDNMLKILQDDDRTQYTYHKTGRSFEIKLRDK